MVPRADQYGASRLSSQAHARRRRLGNGGLPDGAALRVDDADAVAKLAERGYSSAGARTPTLYTTTTISGRISSRKNQMALGASSRAVSHRPDCLR